MLLVCWYKLLSYFSQYTGTIVQSWVSTHGHLEFTGQKSDLGAYMDNTSVCITCIHWIIKNWGVEAYMEMGAYSGLYGSQNLQEVLLLCHMVAIARLRAIFTHHRASHWGRKLFHLRGGRNIQHLCKRWELHTNVCRRSCCYTRDRTGMSG